MAWKSLYEKKRKIPKVLEKSWKCVIFIRAFTLSFKQAFKKKRLKI